MKRHLALVLLLAPLLGCGSKTPPSSPGPSLPRSVSGGIEPDKGGRVGEADGASVTVPPGAVARYVEVAMHPAPPSTHAAPDVRVVGPVWSVTVGGEEHYKFAKPVRLAIPYDPALTLAGAPVGLSVWEDGSWKPVPGASADAASKLVVAEIDHFTEYAPTQNPLPNPDESAKRFLNVESWYGSVSISVHATGHKANGGEGSEHGYTISREAEVRFRIKALPGEAESAAMFDQMKSMSPGKVPPEVLAQMEKAKSERHWHSAFMNREARDEDEYSLAVNDRYDATVEDWGEGGRQGPDTVTHRTLTGGDSGRGAAMHQLVIDVAKGTYSLGCSNLKAGTLTLVETETGKESKTETREAGVGWYLKDRKLPSSGSELSDTIPIKRHELADYIPGIGFWDFSDGSFTGSITWRLSPTPFEDVELVIKPEGYDDWMPEGGADEQKPGNSIKAKATLRFKGTGPTKATLKTLVLRITDVSNVKGVCLNLPLQGGADTPDLKFSSSSEGTIDEKGMRLTQKGTFTTVNFTIDSFDWGAWGAITGQGTLTDGRSVQATLDGDRTMEKVRLPKRDENSKIADKWKQEMKAEGMADTEDKDKQDGNTHDGDGLTLYEEYRGLVAKGKHTRKSPAGKDGIKPLTPQVKDLIVHLDKSIKGKPGVDEGLLLFEKASKIHIVEVDDGEFADSRVVNVNVDASLSAGEQHGLAIFDEKATGPNTAGQTQGASQHVGGPHLLASPAGWEKIVVDFGMHADWYKQSSLKVKLPFPLVDLLANTIAHELAHGVGVAEHGSDDVVRLVNRHFDSSHMAKIYDGDGNPVSLPFDLDGAVGDQHCAGAGDPDCILCYNEYYTWAYLGGDGYYAVPLHAPGKKYCRSNAGVDRNAPHKSGKNSIPGLFGTSEPGNCLGQMRVKDQGK